MEVKNIQSFNSYNNNMHPKFEGSLKSTYLLDNAALEYAKRIKVTDSNWPKLTMFINTIRAIKNDGTANEFVIDLINHGKVQLWSVRYGDKYCRQDELFRSDIYRGKSYGQNVLEEDAFKKIVEFGKEYFGINAITKPIEEFKPADKFLKRVNMFSSKSKQARDRDTATKLMNSAKREEAKAEDEISMVRSLLLCNIIK